MAGDRRGVRRTADEAAPAAPELAASLAERLAPSDRERLAAFRDRFAPSARWPRGSPLDELLRRAIEATDYDLHVLRLPGGARRLANVHKLLRLAAEHERVHGRDVRGLVDRANAELEADARETDAPVELGDARAVRLMTIHAAKGLEFPVVVRRRPRPPAADATPRRCSSATAASALRLPQPRRRLASTALDYVRAARARAATPRPPRRTASSTSR